MLHLASVLQVDAIGVAVNAPGISLAAEWCPLHAGHHAASARLEACQPDLLSHILALLTESLQYSASQSLQLGMLLSAVGGKASPDSLQSQVKRTDAAGMSASMNTTSKFWGLLSRRLSEQISDGSCYIVV